MSLSPVAAPETETLPADVRWMRLGTLMLVFLGAALLVSWLLWRAAHSTVFDWRHIRIEGDTERNSLATLRANALPRLSGNFLTTRLPEVRAAFEAVPWVRHAKVQRVWPAQLRVTLEEHRAVALWDGRGEYGELPLERALLNDHGEVFQANLGEVEDADLPQLAGPNGSEAQVLAMWGRLAAVARHHRQALARLEVSGRGSWRAQLEDGAWVELGRGEPDALQARFDRFLPHALAVARRFGTRVQTADLRHTGGYALKLVGVATKPNPDPKHPAPARRPLPPGRKGAH